MYVYTYSHVYTCALVGYVHTAHKCSYPGCNDVLVLDGNMKNQRDVCAATEAGFIQYSSLAGSIKTGCQLTPLRSSKYCFHHAPRVAQKSIDCPETECTSASTKEDGIVKYLIAKKVTRNATYYQVHGKLSYSSLLSHIHYCYYCCCVGCMA